MQRNISFIRWSGQWLALLCQVVMIYSASMLLETALFREVTPRAAAGYGVLVLVALILRFVCDRQASHASYRASVDVKRILRDKIYSKLLRLGAAYREKVTTSEVVQMAAEGVEQLETYFGKYLSQLFYSLLAPVTLFVILSFVNWQASLVLLICVPLIPRFHCRGSEDREETPEQILGDLYGTGRQLS